MQRQVPTTYLLIGDGRLARHLAHYFTAQKLLFEQWSRRRHDDQILQKMAADADCVLLLIDDDQIDDFINSHAFLTVKTLIHCSGSLVSRFSRACHPLMTFGDTLYPDSFYTNIPFVCDEEANFNQLFPQLNNPSFSLSQSKKSLYHAMAVMAANFPQFIWQSLFQMWDENLNLPHQLLKPLVQQSMLNSFESPQKAPTGPFVRGDSKTIERHQQALKHTPLADLYECFHHWILNKEGGVRV
ncbi:hypothetical protein GCM10011365_11320 [Marinicella pacifica]|jgi:predicted short-subunit dehydrogenase-like oxidoreductase (DUF2520 family)|uniref:DUF2520 domain-containing protein n=1 Tax=Marinicella pacifica TaxID=1171543 RepID=A0A917CKQ3_9GAMM|nr:DUF2520 domain-containing protein [Marinicella pacifica]GGF91840.1 hypothetical protein GCM10011365_11320 [Marinicella pacifica]